MSDEAKGKALKSESIQELTNKVNRTYGQNTLIRGSDIARKVWPRVTTGSIAFDFMLGGGWPLNQWNEVIGLESAGKTVLALKTIASNQAWNSDYECLWIASEDFVPDWAERLGVDLDRTHIVATNIMEDAYQIAYEALDGQVVDALVIDSLPALLPGEEAEKAMAEFSMGLGARLTAKFMRKTHQAQKRSLAVPERDCLALLINQWRDKIGITWGDPRTTPGGKAKNFSMFTRVEVARDVWLTLEDKDKTRVGLGIKARTIKNKTAPAQRTASVDFYFDDALPFVAGQYDNVKQIFNLAVAHEIISVTGRTYTYAEETLGTSKAVAQQSVRESLELQTNIAREVLALA